MPKKHQKKIDKKQKIDLNKDEVSSEDSKEKNSNDENDKLDVVEIDDSENDEKSNIIESIRNDSNDDDDNDDDVENDTKSQEFTPSKGAKNKKKKNKKDKKQKKKKMQNDNTNDDDNDDEDKSQNKEECQSLIRKIPLNINPDYDVPDCYTKFFDIKTQEDKKLTLSFRQTKYKKKITEISWENNKTKNIFTKTQLKDIKSYIQNKFATSCSIESNLILIQGNIKSDLLIDFFVKDYNFKKNDIKIKNSNYTVPKGYTIEIVSDETNNNLSEVILCKQKFECVNFNDFVNGFEDAMTKEWNMEIVRKRTIDNSLHIYVKGDNSDYIFNNYFVDTCHMKPSEIKKQKKLLLSQKYSKMNTYREMMMRFAGFDPSDYFVEMSNTIQDAYFEERDKLRELILSINLQFTYLFYDRGDKTCYWCTYINIANIHYNDNDVKSSHMITEGVGVTVKYKLTGSCIQGMITKVRPDGWATVNFMLNNGEIPGGCTYVPPSMKGMKIKEANRVDYDDLVDDDDEEIKKLEATMFSSYGNYIVKFLPNKSAYKKSAKALLVLNDLESPIKDIITNEMSTIDPAMNKVSDVTIKEASFDLRDMPGVEEYKDNPNIMKYLHLTPTPSQIECINSILQNRISLIQGPPGCGKTTSIGFFVYQLLNLNRRSDKKRILLCAYSNQAVENIVKFVSPIVKALGKKMVWIPKKSACFETKEDFENASEEEKNLSYYKILIDSKAECAEYMNLQVKKWRYEEEMNKYYEAKLSGNLSFYSWDQSVQYFTEKDYKRMCDIQLKVESKFVSESDVVCCTLLQSAKSSIVDYKFEYVFIDEATQVDQINSIIPLIHQPSKMILLGDHKQLDPFVSMEMQDLHPYTTQSLYLYLISKKLPHTMLKTQFRMNPLIAEFPNKQFYDNCIESAADMEEKTKINLVGIQTPILFVDVKDGVEKSVYGTSFKNENEANVVYKILNNIQMNNISGSEVGVITPYYGQKQLLRDMASSLNYKGVRISSVDSFQGSERDFIILSLVRTNKSGNFGFLSNENRINVSITRARKGLIIVGNFNAIINSNENNMNPRNQFLVNLCNFYQEKNAVVDDSSILMLTKRVSPVPVSSIVYHQNLKDDDDYDYDYDYYAGNY